MKEVLGFLDNDDFFYTNEEDFLFMWYEKEEESIRISSGMLAEFKLYADRVVYVGGDGANTDSLFQVMLDKEMASTKVAENVQSFDFHENRYY